MSFSAFNMLNFVRGSVYISYFEKTADGRLTAKEVNEGFYNPDKLNEVKLIYYFPDNCDVFEEVKKFFYLAKDRAKVFNRELSNIQQLIRDQSGGKVRNVVVYEVLELNALAFYEGAKGFDLKKEYKLSKMPSLFLKRELERATLYFLKKFGLMSKISFQFKFDFWLDVYEEEISSNLYSIGAKKINAKTLDKHTKEMIKILSKPNLFNYSLFAEIKETF